MGCEATHREQRMGIQWRKLVFDFIPICRLTIGLQPSHPRLPTFCSPSSIKTPPSHPIKSNISYWYCPLCTPSLTLPPSSLKCLQKSNPNIHRKCFRCFRCFKCFISLLDHKIARFWSKSELNPQTHRIAPPPYNGYGKHPKKQFTYWFTNTILPRL